MAEVDKSERYSLTELPKELLIVISGFVSARTDFGALLFTSKVFSSVVRSAWSSLSLRADNKINYHQFFTFRAERLKSIVELDVSYCNQMSNALFAQILQQVPDLKVLKMRGCKRLNRLVASKIGSLKLTHLDIRECNRDLVLNLASEPGVFATLTSLSTNPFLFAKCVRHLDFDLIRSLKFNTELCIDISPADFIEASSAFENLEELCVKFAIWGHLDMTHFAKLKSLVVTSPIYSLKLGNPKQLKKLRVQFAEAGETKVCDGQTKETIDQLVNIESLTLHGYSNKLQLTNYPKLRKIGGDSVITNHVSDLVNYKQLEKIWIGSGVKEIDAIKVLAANQKLTTVKYDEPLSAESLEALAKFRLEKLQVLLRGDVRFDWSRFKALKSLTIRVEGEVDNSALFKQFKSIPNLEQISIFFRLSDEEIAKQTIAPLFEGFPALKRITVITPLPQSLSRLESIFFNELYAMKQITFVDVATA